MTNQVFLPTIFDERLGTVRFEEKIAVHEEKKVFLRLKSIISSKTY